MRYAGRYKRGHLYLQLATQVAARLKHAESISTSTPYPQYIPILSGLSSIKQFRTTNTLSFPGLLKNLFNAIPKVTHLELPLPRLPLHRFVIYPHHAPLLQELVCPVAFAPLLVPGRPVHRLILRWSTWADGPNVFELLEEMARSTKTIKRLGLLIGSRVNLQADIEEIFSATARFLPDVEEVTVWLEFWKSRTDLLERLLRELTENLTHFSKLRILDFNGSMGYGVVYFDHRRNAISGAYTTILETWSSNCPTLEKVIFPNGAVRVKEPLVNRSASPKNRSFLPLSRPASVFHPLDSEVKERERPLAQSDMSENDFRTMMADTDPNLEQAKMLTSYRWCCTNPYVPKSNRPVHSYTTRSHKPELDWSMPTFETDPMICWPEELDMQNWIRRARGNKPAVAMLELGEIGAFHRQYRIRIEL